MEPVVEAIRKRHSCRNYDGQPLREEDRQRVEAFLNQNRPGPFGNRVRFMLVSAGEQDRSALKGLGTYGVIRGAPAFIIGAVDQRSPQNLEDYGYLAEDIVLFATALGLGTCWLGGFFTRSTFARKMGLKDDEIIPAVISIGYAAHRLGAVNLVIRQTAGSDHRLPWSQLFFDGDFGTPLTTSRAGKFSEALEMVRLGPSASNRQPWRILGERSNWHFYLQRTPGYRLGINSMLKLADLQRVDLGIAMCHFEQTAHETGLAGVWQVRDPELDLPDPLMEYSGSWVAG